MRTPVRLRPGNGHAPVSPARSRLQPLTTGKLLISAGALFTGIGAFVADWNETHVLNPDWSGHAKFHNAQTMSLAATMAVLTLAQLWRPGLLDTRRLRSAVLFASIFWITQVPAPFFPGSVVVDPDQPTQPFHLGPVPVNQITATAAVLLPLLAGGYVLERRLIRRRDGT